MGSAVILHTLCPRTLIRGHCKNLPLDAQGGIEGGLDADRASSGNCAPLDRPLWIPAFAGMTGVLAMVSIWGQKELQLQHHQMFVDVLTVHEHGARCRPADLKSERLIQRDRAFVGGRSRQLNGREP